MNKATSVPFPTEFEWLVAASGDAMHRPKDARHSKQETLIQSIISPLVPSRIRNRTVGAVHDQPGSDALPLPTAHGKQCKSVLVSLVLRRAHKYLSIELGANLDE